MVSSPFCTSLIYFWSTFILTSIELHKICLLYIHTLFDFELNSSCYPSDPTYHHPSGKSQLRSKHTLQGLGYTLRFILPLSVY